MDVHGHRSCLRKVHGTPSEPRGPSDHAGASDLATRAGSPLQLHHGSSQRTDRDRHAPERVRGSTRRSPSHRSFLGQPRDASAPRSASSTPCSHRIQRGSLPQRRSPTHSEGWPSPMASPSWHTCQRHRHLCMQTTASARAAAAPHAPPDRTAATPGSTPQSSETWHHIWPSAPGRCGYDTCMVNRQASLRDASPFSPDASDEGSPRAVW